ncbi:SDR family oxidoreductase [Myxococcota bacterium]|nr:SDR family oxidoreductase [Myxococcota bacterium]
MGALDEKAIVITGGAGTLGRAYARAAANEGAAILVNDVNAERAEHVAESIREAGGRAQADSSSVESWDTASEIIQACLSHFGRLDGLITSAHRTSFGPIWDLTEEDLDVTLNAHVKGHFACVHHAALVMREQRSGSIITVGSRALNGLPGVSTYAGAKGAIMSATFSWALELAEYGVRVNCINPAAMLGKGEPAEHMRWHWDFSVERVGWSEPVPSANSVAPLAVYLLSDHAEWITGQVVFLSGDTLALLDHPREKRFAFRPEGWSLEDLCLHFRDTIGANLEMPGMDVPIYPWRNGVGRDS